ncbi:MAG: tetratricopeptide repeat protein [Bacteroidales bacterium]|nr:tetratricopeptide repeat protein [Bacteroidales bacterium]
MKNVQFVFLLSLLVLVACSSPQQESRKSIEAAETEFYGGKESRMDEKMAIHLIQLYGDYAKAYQEDTLSAEYLYKAAELSMSINQGSQAIQFFENIRKGYPSFGKIADVTFMIAFVYETQLGNLDKAKEYYEKFIHEYPEHHLQDDAVASINNLGKPLDQLIQEFEAANSVEETAKVE